MNVLLDAALRYAARGWQIIPCHTPNAKGVCSCQAGAECESSGKHPRIAWKGKASTDPDVIKSWWKQWPHANIGIATGIESGIIVMDVDGDEGAATIARHGGTEAGPRSTTGRGEHRFLEHPGFRTKNFVKRDGLDLRGDGGLVIVAPSLHLSGNRYAWIGETEHLDPAPVPAWFLEMIQPEPEPVKPLPVVSSTTSARTLAYASVALERELVKLSECGNGTRNKQLNESALKLGHIIGAGWINETTVEHALLTTAMAIGLPKHEAIATINSGISAGRKEPTVLEDRPLDPNDPKLGLKIKDTKRISKGEQAVEPAEVHWMERIVDAADYPGKEFDPLVWTVPGLLPEGCFLFAGAPKTGKSWVALQIALAVATGGLLFGKIQVEQADVLYLDLESNQRRMKSRLEAMIGEDDWPARGTLMITNDADRLPELVDRLDEWMLRKPRTRLIVIDIFENIRPDDSNVKNVNLYRLDYNSIRLLTRWADAYHVTILMLHHTNKMHSPDNQFNKISGSTGLTGATSGAWVMGGTEKDEYVLKVQGRDLESSDDLFLKWDSFLCKHVLAGSGALYSISDERKAILEVMDNDQEWSPRELAEEVNKPVTAIGKLLRALVADRLVEKASYGKYVKIRQRLTYGLLNIGQTGQSSQTPQTGQSSQTSPNLDSDTINPDQKSDRSSQSLTDSDFGGGQSSNRLQSPKTAQNPNSDRSDRYSRSANLDSRTINPGQSDYDHDKAREREIITAIDRHDYKAARRSVLAIRGRKDGERLSQMIDDDEQQYRKAKEQNGGYITPEGYA